MLNSSDFPKVPPTVGSNPSASLRILRQGPKHFMVGVFENSAVSRQSIIVIYSNLLINCGVVFGGRTVGYFSISTMTFSVSPCNKGLLTFQEQKVL